MHPSETFADHLPAHHAVSGWLRTLNPEQKAAVVLPAEHALILAGAGSGKTRVLTTRMAWLLETGQVSPGGILAVTFTNKAAREMTERMSGMLSLNIRAMWIGTFHGLCHRLLRLHWKAAGLAQGFQILDTQDQLSAIKRLLKSLRIDEERVKPRELQWFIAGSKEEGLRPHECPTRHADERERAELYQLYEAQCQREGVVDFGELILRSYELLRDHAELRVHYQSRFRHVLVDEFQDTNRLQYAWLKLMAGGEGQALFAVGDDDQSIYAFRGARVGNMADFVREFGVRHQIKLEENYRSHGHILAASNRLIAHNQERLGKALRTRQGDGEPLRIMEATDDLAEARWVVETLTGLVEDGVERQEIAILYRSNAQSRVLEGALFQAGVPYRVHGGLRFFERAEIKHALAYLRLLLAPHDDASFLRVVNFPPRGIGARSMEQLQDAARVAGVPLQVAVATLGGRAAAALGAFVGLMEDMRAATQGTSLRVTVETMLEQSGLLRHYATEKDGADRLENLEELIHAAEAFALSEGEGRHVSEGDSVDSVTVVTTTDGTVDTPGPAASLQTFLSHAALEAGDHQAQDGQEAVQLMTVHAAKGLEFDVVFITGLEEGLFPHDQSANTDRGLEEERRLMYVAMTRARRRLYLSHAQTRMLHGQTRYHLPSRFYEELPEQGVKWLVPPRPRSGAQGLWPASGSWGRSGGGEAVSRASSQVLTSQERQAPVSGAAAPGAVWRPGMGVFHTKFGEGRIVQLEGSGDDAKVQVAFKRHGSKWLLLSLAKLTAIE